MNGTVKSDYIGYEYKKITTSLKQVSFYIDCYENFGWAVDENFTVKEGQDSVTFQLKRDRKIINKMELTRLQKNFEACANEIEQLEKSKSSTAMISALSAGIIGTAFIAGSTFAVVHEPPVIWLCIVLAVPGFIGWILPYFLYRMLAQKKTKEIQPIIDAKYDEIYEICKKGYSLL